jgi:WD40 repeat protein
LFSNFFLFFIEVNQEIINVVVDDPFIKKEIKLINLNTGHVIKNLNINRFTHFCLSYDVNPIGNNDNAKVISFQSMANYVDVWSLYSGERLHQLEHANGVECIKCLAKNRLITSTERGIIKIWDLLQGRCLFSLNSHYKAVILLDTVPNEANMFISGDNHGILRIWDLNKPKKKCITKIKVSYVNNKLIKALTQGLLACLSYNSQLDIWNYKTSERVITLKGHTDRINDLEFSPSENWLISCSNDKTIRIWSMSTFECVQVLEQFECIEKIHLINRVSHHRQMPYTNSSSSLKLLTQVTSENRRFNIWDLSTNECVETFPFIQRISQFNVCLK